MTGARGGARFTHANLLAADLDYIAIEACIARQDLAAGGEPDPERWRVRFHQFIEDVEFLVRSGAHHLKALNA